jgi:hypothetical protein
MKIHLECGPAGSYLLYSEDGRDLFVQTKWDFRGVVSSFGWQACPCGGTDGTIGCEHKTVGEMIASAAEFLDEHLGDEAESPGYFN